MYREFYIGKSLARQPFLYAATHQVIILPLTRHSIGHPFARVDLRPSFARIPFLKSVRFLPV
jgi:hypothetical protein